MTEWPLSSPESALRLLRRFAGGALVLLVVVPFWKLLSGQTAPIAREAVRLTDSYATLLFQGTVAVLVLAAVAASFVSADSFERPFEQVAAKLDSFNGTRYAIVIATMSGVLTAVLSLYVWDAMPVLVDVLAQLVHARFFAEGLLAGPPGLPYEFWVSSNTFVTEHGWVSQYPPGHILFLAFGFAVHAVWLVCPALMATAVFFTSLTAERLFPNDKVVARTGSLLFAVSPYLLSLAAAFMSHVTVVACLAIAAYCALRARDEAWAWALATGLAVGAAFATRSLSALVIGAVITLGPWLTDIRLRERPLRFLLTRLGAAAAGALPFVIGVAAYNAHFFGSPFEFGYTAYLGANHGLGYHPDPFGNAFGPTEGLAYTSSDLLALGYFLLRTPVSVVLLAGLYLIFSRRLSGGGRLVTAWALCLTVPLAAYWHHDLLLGPRMISDAAPAWCLLTAVAGLGLVRSVAKDTVLLGGRFSPRVFVGAALTISLALAVGYFIPHDLSTYARTFGTSPEAPRANSQALVFVHGGWQGRIVAQLLGNGMRADSVNIGVGLNSSCSMQEFAEAYAERRAGGTKASLPQISFADGVSDGSTPTRLPNGVVIRAKPDEELTPSCLAQAHSDRGGTIPLMPILWQGDLPGLPGAGAMFVRDLGPTENARLIARYPNRRVGVLLRRPDDGSLTILPYETGMELLWGGGPSEDDGG